MRGESIMFKTKMQMTTMTEVLTMVKMSQLLLLGMTAPDLGAVL